MTLAQLNRFIARRNKSPHKSNLQFLIDRDAVGLTEEDLPQAVKVVDEETGAIRWEWKTIFGTLVEEFGQMRWGVERDDD